VTVASARIEPAPSLITHRLPSGTPPHPPAPRQRPSWLTSPRSRTIVTVSLTCTSRVDLNRARLARCSSLFARPPPLTAAAARRRL
jgi:hypothetical protein